MLNWRYFRKKRIFALLLAAFLLVLFSNSSLWGQWMYPIHYEREIKSEAVTTGLDPYLIAAIVRVESNYKPKMVSKKGAVGLMQLMPDTAAWIVGQSRLTNITPEQMQIPELNIKMGAWYLKSLYSQFNGNETAVIAAYNAGPGNVSKWLQNHIWDGSYDKLDQVPYGETRHYVQRVFYYYNKYLKIYTNHHNS